MTPDALLVTGLALALFGLPALVAAWSDRRRPRTALVLLAGASLCIALAEIRNPGGYALSDMPETVYGVIGDLLH